MSEPVVELLSALVRTASPSGDESRAACLLAEWAERGSLGVTRDDAAVCITVPGQASGPVLVLASHLDTVPPGEGWTVEPYGAVVRDGRLFGRGAVDAKGSVAAMATAALAVAQRGGPTRGVLKVLATYGEETRATSMPRALARLGALPDGAIVGEPTGLRPCVAQRGQVLLKLVWRGEQIHAGWAAAEATARPNAITLAAADLHSIGSVVFDRVHPRLGRIAVTPTMISGGVARNVTPPRCEVVLDIRTTPSYTHREIVEAIAGQVGADVEVLSDRLVPAETPDDSRVLEALNRVRPGIGTTVSPTCSDWVFLRETDTVKLGPGDSRISHTADESVVLDDVVLASQLYADVAMEYLT